MKAFTYSEARQNLASLLELALNEDVEIRRRDGSTFILRAKRSPDRSPLDVPGISTQVRTEDILEAIRDSRARS